MKFFALCALSVVSGSLLQSLNVGADACPGNLEVCQDSDCTQCSFSGTPPGVGCYVITNPDGSQLAEDITHCNEWHYTENIYSGGSCTSGNYLATVSVSSGECTAFELFGTTMYARWTPDHEEITI